MADFLWTYELNFFRYILCFFRAHRDIWMVIKIVKIPTKKKKKTKQKNHNIIIL
jgi:hypothetical protein